MHGVTKLLNIVFHRKIIKTPLTHKRDLSYGLYIYHGIVLNLFIHLGFDDNYVHFLIYLGFAMGLAMMSWEFVERSALRYKKYQ